uniref:Uncharacterized protein n=1 Tax=Anguilla anguilla TaxID=7936 RepID=A0A0E9QVN0_ANGAN
MDIPAMKKSLSCASYYTTGNVTYQIESQRRFYSLISGASVYLY